MVAEGHNTSAPSSLTYSSVITGQYKDSLNISTSNSLKVIAFGTHNTYLTAKDQENIWTVADPDFASKQGKAKIVVR